MNFKELVLNWEKRFDREVIDRFRDGLSSFAKNREAEIGAEYDNEELANREDGFEHQLYLSFLEDEASYLSDIIELGDELSIIALYKKIELTRKRILKRSYSTLDERQLSYFNYLKDNVPFDITQIDGAIGVDELRLINNAIKHQGKVSTKLASYNSWIKGKELSGLGEAYKRLAPESEKYIASLVDAIKSYNANAT